MIRSMKYLTIKRLSKWLISFLAIAVLITLVTNWTLVRDVRNLNASWTINERSIIQKQAYLSALRGTIGYGGMIHYFKNYLLRQENRYLLNTYRSMLETKIILSGYRASGVSPEEENALSNIESVIQKYTSAIARAEALIKAGYSVSDTDKQVAVDDTLALRSLLSLTDVLATMRQAKTGVVSAKISSLSDAISLAATGIGVLLVSLILLLTWFLRYRLINPIAKLTAAIGQIDPRMPGRTRLPGTENKDDELSTVASAVNQFLDSMETHLTERQIAEQALEAAKVTADKANQSKTNFLANMSHEIRTPMNGVVGMVDVLSNMKFEPEQRRMIQTIKNSSFSLLRIIDDILDTTKIEAGKLELEAVSVHLRPVIEGVAETMMSAADDGSVKLSLFIDPALPEWVNSDATRLRQVLLNLISNAVKFSRREKGAEPGSVELRADLMDNMGVQFTVTDTGIGMTEEIMSKLFKPFSQGEESTTREFGGTGLGLMISHNLVDMMGGTIAVDSTPGVGSTFTVRLPLRAVEGDSETPHISNLEIVALTNDPAFRRDVAAYIEGYGATIRYAENETELGALVAQAPFSSAQASSIEKKLIVVLALESMSDNEQVRNALPDAEGQLRFLFFTTHRSERLGLVQPNLYVLQRSPVLPSDMLRGLSVLAEGESPDVDVLVPDQAPSAPATTTVKAHIPLILMVEDNSINQEVLKYMLEMLEYPLEIAEDGKQGLEMWRTGRFDIILSDCHMPVMDGFEMTVAIREAEKQNGSPPVPIIAITANALKGEAERCLATGMDDYLSKPVELDQLKKTLERWLPKIP
jgi:two-component system, sensor histidine kinase SagS